MGIETPWGRSQSSEPLCPGVAFHSCAGHGGYSVTPEVLATWPEGLREHPAYAGPGWYEEDQDWAIVALAMPEHFNDKSKWNALKTVMMDDRSPGVEKFLATERGRALVESITAWEAQQGAMKMYQPSGGGTGGKGWCQTWAPVGHDGPTLRTRHVNVPDDMPSLAHRVLLEAKYGTVESL